ncbi:MAG: DUF839 domain-containing protein [Trueperaceae bacterium]|nr:DUF839 domain-containing protein [Trueperaceae bacterium]
MRNALLLLAVLFLSWSSSQSFPAVALDHPAAPFIMTYAFAKDKGATAEFNKMEGVALDAQNMKLYIAISDVTKAMTDGEGAIALEENRCGQVMVADLDDAYNILKLEPFVVGGPYNADDANRCALGAISNPDNIAVDAKGRVWIGEDTGNHQNNMLFVFDPATQELKRFATVPNGAEVTGLHISQNGTLFMNVQHPDPENVYPFNRSVIGVVAGFNANTDEFEALSVPEGDERKVARVAAGSYQVLGRTGDAMPGELSGAAFGEVRALHSGETLLYCNDFDGNMFLPTNETGTEGYLYTNYECVPGGISKIYIRATDMGWEVIDGEYVDFASVNGTRTNCFASVTPWNTGLSGEEYPAESADAWASEASALTTYVGGLANPFDYGYAIEVMPEEGVGSKVVKHYAMGRLSVENALVMPDEKTVYFGDDGSERVLYKFVADEARNLDVGTLYAGKITQDGSSLMIEWLELGHGNSDEIAQAIRELDSQLTAAN